MVAVEFLLTLVGAGMGAVLRFVIGGWISHRAGAAFPWGTLVVNTLGCFGLGLLQGAPREETLILILGSGLLAGFTTFSTLMLETLNLVLAREYDRSFFNVLGSVALGLPALFVGLYLGTGL
jgi:CrcB protein